jgi:hypothetical protein
MLVTPVDFLFLLAGLAVTVWALWRRWTPPTPEPAPAGSRGELVLTALALVPAAVGPNILVVALTPGMPGMPALVRWALVPSLVLLVAVFVVARARRYDRLTNRIWTGVWVGAASTAALDLFRLATFLLGLLPGNMPRMFGVLILDTMATGPTTFSDVIGELYHVVGVSAAFGLTYALIMGRTRWWGGLIWGLIIEVGMMTTPPMVIAMDTGYFGLKLGHGLFNGVFIGSLIPHISYGIALGLLLERYIRHEGTIVALVRDVVRHAGQAPAAVPARVSRAG